MIESYELLSGRQKISAVLMHFREGYVFNDVAKDSLDEWVYFLKHEEIKDNFAAKGLPEAKAKLNELKLSAGEKQEYDRYLEDLRYQVSVLSSNYAVGKIDGKIEVARKMKIAGMPDDVIQKFTELTLEEVQSL